MVELVMITPEIQEVAAGAAQMQPVRPAAPVLAVTVLQVQYQAHQLHMLAAEAVVHKVLVEQQVAQVAAEQVVQVPATAQLVLPTQVVVEVVQHNLKVDHIQVLVVPVLSSSVMQIHLLQHHQPLVHQQ
jgi:hypothetical protein